MQIPAGGVSIFGSVPPAEIPKLRTHQNTEPKTAVVEEPETQLPGKSSPNSKLANISDRGSSVDDHETTSHSSLTSRGYTSSQGSLNEPVAHQHTSSR